MTPGFRRRLALAGADALHLLARFEITFGRSAAAEPLLRQAAELCRRAGPAGRPGLLTLLNQVAVLQYGQGRVAEAEVLYARVEAEARADGEAGLEHVVHAALNLGLLYQMLGRAGDAEGAYRRSRTAATALGQDHECYVTAIEHLGRFYVLQGKTDEAAGLLRKAYKIRRLWAGRAAGGAVRRYTVGLWGDNRAGFAQSMISLAQLEAARGDTVAAERMLREALAELVAVGRGRTVTYLQGVEKLARLRLQAGDYQRAYELFREATRTDPQGLGDSRPGLADALISLAMAAVGAGRAAEAGVILGQASGIQDRGLGEALALGTEGHQLAYLGRQRAELDLALTLAAPAAGPAGPAADGFERVLKRKGLAVEVFASRREAVYAGRFPHLKSRFEALARVRSRHAELSFAGPGPAGPAAHRLEIDRLAKDRDVLEAALAREVPDASPTRVIAAATVARLGAELHRWCPAAGLAEFIRFSPFRTALGPHWVGAEYLAFVLPPGGRPVPRLVRLGLATEIDRAVADFRADVLAGRERNRPARSGTRVDPAAQAAGDAGLRLRRLVLDPVRAVAPGARRWLLAPDAELHTIPFEALPEDDGSRAMDRNEFSYLGVGRDVFRFGRAAADGTDPVVVAGPDFDLAGGGGVPAGPTTRARYAGLGRFDRLIGAEAEGREVAALLGVRPLLGPDALKAAVQRARSPRVLHLATHGFTVPPPTAPAGAAAGRWDRVFTAPPDNPLLRSGLALAGANAWLDARPVPPGIGTGLLTAEEVTGLDLTGTRLVVLSACETGLGDVVGGEGVMGLRRAFVLAGAAALVVSLWPVPDDATRRLMAGFYQVLRAGQPADHALRTAQQAERARNPDPLAWAGFVFLGDPAPVPV